MERILDRWLLGAGGLVALLVVSIFLTYRKTEELHEDGYWVAHTHEVMDTLEEAVGHMREAEGIQRSYVILGGDTIPPDFAANIAAAKQKVEKFKGLTVDNAEQQARIPEITRQLEELAAFWSHTLKVRKEEGFDAAKKIVEAEQSSKAMAELQGRLREMDDAERKLLGERQEKRQHTYNSARITGLLTGLMAVIGVVAFTLLLRRHLAARTAAAAEIAEQRERLRTTLASIGDAVIATDTRGRVTMMNAVAESLTGWKADEANGQPLDVVFRIVNEETRRTVEDPVTRAVREGIIVGLANHTLLIAKSGTERAIDDSAAPIRCKEGLVVGCVLVFRDVSEQRRVEAEQRRLVAALSEGDRRKNEFLATLAHELRNPLAPIRNALQILRLSGEREVKEQARTMMERQLSQLVHLVDDLMDVSRITRDNLELRKERVQLADALNGAVEISRPLLDHMGHEFTVTLPPQPIYLDADMTRLAQVFANLLNNAAKYTERGGRIWLTAERQGSDVVVSIKDTGIGIDADQMSRIFGMFMQVDRSLERSQGGLGIGLTLVKRLLEMHSGRIEAKSEGPGRGSEFVVRLPVVVEGPAPPAAEQDEPAAPKSSLRILIVDDNRDSADSLSLLLRIMGNDLRTAYDGQQGVDLAEEFRPDVVLLDIGLPKLNGYEACRRIREQPWGKCVVLIAVTGWGQDEDRRLSQDAGFDHHLVKPVNPQDLMKMLADLQQAKREKLTK